MQYLSSKISISKCILTKYTFGNPINICIAGNGMKNMETWAVMYMYRLLKLDFTCWGQYWGAGIRDSVKIKFLNGS